MKILYLCPRFPWPADRGDRIRNLNNLRTLSSAHEVTLVCFGGGENETDVTALRNLVHAIHIVPLKAMDLLTLGALSVLKGLPFHVSYFQSGAMHRLVRTLASGGTYDLLFVNMLRMVPYCRDLHIPVVVDLTDSLALNYEQRLRFGGRSRRAYYGYETLSTRRYERWVTRTFHNVTVCSHTDGHFMQSQDPTCSPTVVPNAVDTAYFCPNDGQANPTNLVFTGTMDYLPNVDAVRLFVERILPLIRAHVADVSFTIVGRNPSKQVQDLTVHEGVRVTGGVADIRPYLWRASVFVAPMRIATGTQNKVLEAMAVGLPVVTTSRVASTLGMGQSEGMLVFDEPEDIARAIIRVIDNRDLRQELGLKAREAVLNTYSTEAVYQGLLDVVEGSVKATTQGGRT